LELIRNLGFGAWNLLKVMSKVVSIEKARSAKIKKTADAHSAGGFVPCSQDMTICGDCDGNRAKKKCPRLKEWVARRQKS
jgi:hypothetical protein